MAYFKLSTSCQWRWCWKEMCTIGFLKPVQAGNRTPCPRGVAQPCWPKDPSLNRKTLVHWFSALAAMRITVGFFEAQEGEIQETSSSQAQFTYSASTLRHSGKMVRIALLFSPVPFFPFCVSTFSLQEPRALIQLSFCWQILFFLLLLRAHKFYFP